ncbi:MAG: pyridoxal-phosphate dependent enzyme, partial [Pseudomonadota bacterium]
MSAASRLSAALAQYPRACMAHGPTPVERLANLSADTGISISVKRDDCTGIGLGGNKVRQLEFYLGEAQHNNADTVLITGAVQSNFVRTTAAMAARLGMHCHVQLEERVDIDNPSYRTSGNVLLNRLLGATLHSYPAGEDESGADLALDTLATELSASG